MNHVNIVSVWRPLRGRHTRCSYDVHISLHMIFMCMSYHFHILNYVAFWVDSRGRTFQAIKTSVWALLFACLAAVIVFKLLISNPGHSPWAWACFLLIFLCPSGLFLTSTRFDLNWVFQHRRPS